MSAIAITRLRQLTVPQRTQLAAIYTDAFPPSERVEFATLVTAAETSARWLFIATRADSALGFAIIAPHIGHDVHLLEYLAVARTARGDGIGSTLMRHLAHELRAARGILIEVESDAACAGAERVLRQRRIAFYARLGAQVIPGVPNYRTPNYAGGDTIAMKLLWLPLCDPATPRSDALREWVRQIYAQVYHLNANDALVQKTFQGMSAP